MGNRNLTEDVGNLRLPSGKEIRLVAIATDDHDVLCSVENAAATIGVEIDTGRDSLRTLGLEATVEPADLDLRKGELRHVVTCREGQFDHLGARAAVGKYRSGAGLSLDGITELEALERNVHDMASHITHSTCSEVPPAAEVPRMVDLVVVTHRSGSDESIPVQG